MARELPSPENDGPFASSRSSGENLARRQTGVPAPLQYGAEYARMLRDLQIARAQVVSVLERVDAIVTLIEPVAKDWLEQQRSGGTPAATGGRLANESRTLMRALREARLQVILGLVAGFAAVAIAVYLFAGSR